MAHISERMDGEMEEQTGPYTEEAMTLANMVLPVLLTRKVLFQESFLNSSMVSSDMSTNYSINGIKGKEIPRTFSA